MVSGLWSHCARCCLQCGLPSSSFLATHSRHARPAPLSESQMVSRLDTTGWIGSTRVEGRAPLPRSTRRKSSRCAANRSYLAENPGPFSSKPPRARSKSPRARVKSPRPRAKSPRARAKFLQARAKPPQACTKVLQVYAEILQADTDIVQARDESRAHAAAAAARRRSEVAAVGERPRATHGGTALRRCEPALRRALR